MAVYPRKQTFVILVACILFVGGISFYVRGDFLGFFGKEKEEKASLSIKENISVSTQEVLSTNEDWRRQFLGKNATSTTLKTNAKAAVAEGAEKLTATDLLGRAFLTKYGELQQSGLINDSGSAENVIGQVTAEVLANLPPPKTFSVSEIKSSVASPTTLSAYGKAVMSAFQAYMPKKNDAEIANEALASGDMSILKQIDPIIAGYKNMLSVFKSMSVPTPLVQYHKTLLDGVSMALYNAESMRQIDTNPVQGLAAVAYELVALEKISQALSSIGDYFNKSGVHLD